MSRNPIWDKWAEWLGPEPTRATIYGAMMEMIAARQIWESFNDIIGVAPEQARRNSTFHTWFNSAYTASQGLAIRRQVEARSDVISIGRLLKDIASQPTVLSRAEFVARFYPGDEQQGNRDWEAQTSPGADSIDPALPQTDLDHLRRETQPIKKWIDKEVAHYDPRTGRFSEGLTFGDLHRAVDLVYDTMRRYYALIVGAHIVGSIAMSAWPVVFKVAWIPDEEAWRGVMRRIDERDRSRL